MDWTNGNVRVAHPREPWGSSGGVVLVNCRLDELKGTYTNVHGHADKYQAAKFRFDMEAAFDVVEACAQDRVIDRLADIIMENNTPPRLVLPHPAFDDDDATGNQEPIKPLPTNALPFAYAARLGEQLACEVDDSIVQNARVGRTKLTRWLRFLCQPSFVGEVPKGQTYILVDDVMTTGGTMAALRSYIMRAGGRVVASCCLAHNSGADQAFGVAPSTVAVLKSLYSKRIDSYWTETFGHDIQCLTQVEAEILARYARVQERGRVCQPGEPMLEQLRNRINAAAAKGG